MQVRTVVDEEVFNVREDLVHHLYANIGDDAWVLYYISQPILHQLRMTHLTCKSWEVSSVIYGVLNLIRLHNGQICELEQEHSAGLFEMLI